MIPAILGKSKTVDEYLICIIVYTILFFFICIINWCRILNSNQVNSGVFKELAWGNGSVIKGTNYSNRRYDLIPRTIMGSFQPPENPARVWSNVTSFWWQLHSTSTYVQLKMGIKEYLFEGFMTDFSQRPSQEVNLNLRAKMCFFCHMIIYSIGFID